MCAVGKEVGMKSDSFSHSFDVESLANQFGPVSQEWRDGDFRIIQEVK
jgi:hypothetical protein